MQLMLYNTLTRKKEVFAPLKNNIVRAYFCGPTVQDSPHIGHARAFIAFDILVRYLKFKGYKVFFIRNVTDIDDKIIEKAKKENVTPFEIAHRYYLEFLHAADALKLLHPNIEPFATGHIPEIIELIKKLIDKGFAYTTKSGDVYFDVLKFKEYGKLSGQRISELKAGARIKPGEEKKNPIDFALWKAAKPGEPSWPSPWGRGRPGWHIECSAMTMKYLGETIDIHGGGADLIFPHHENEIAQSEAATGKPFARFWFHVGLLRMRGDKMSKSLGNIVPIFEALRRYDHETIRLWAINTHYRKPIDFYWDLLENTEKILDDMYSSLFLAEQQLETEHKTTESLNDFNERLRDFIAEFKKAMNDDLNTPKALGILRDFTEFLKSNLNRLSKSQIETAIKEIRELGWVLGILQMSLEERIQEKRRRGKDISTIVPPNYIESGDIKPFLDLIIAVRNELRKRKIFDLADSIRERLKQMGIALEDSKEGTKWRIKK
ncbi:MAG: cysteine--tRNA ligase [Candidatus Njordarchaeia archaeon]